MSDLHDIFCGSAKWLLRRERFYETALGPMRQPAVYHFDDDHDPHIDDTRPPTRRRTDAGDACRTAGDDPHRVDRRDVRPIRRPGEHAPVERRPRGRPRLRSETEGVSDRHLSRRRRDHDGGDRHLRVERSAFTSHYHQYDDEPHQPAHVRELR